MSKRKYGIGVMLFLLVLIIIVGVADYLIPQLPALSLSEGIFEAIQIVLTIMLALTGGAFALKK